tara:strand:+ start:2143 stop:2985 length:843 start_codon:yes stop_codon:yes gene_type:complete
MAIATTTALAIGGLALSAGTTAASFGQANKQKKIQQQAEKDAEKSMEKARKALGVNYFEDLAVQKEKFELERDATLQAQAGATQAMQEGGARAVAGGVGRVALAGQQQQAQTRTAMGKELSELQRLTAQEDTRLRDLGVQLDLEEAAGAQLAAQNAQEIRAQKIGEGITGAMSVAQQGLSMVPLYQQNMTAQKAAVAGMEFTPDEFSKFGTIGQAGGLAGSGQEFSNLDLKSVGGMNNKQFRQFKQSLTPEQQAMIFGTKQFTDAYKSVDTSAMNPFNLR